MLKQNDFLKTFLFFFLPTIMLIIGIFLFEYPLEHKIINLLSVPLFLSLILLLAGFVLETNISRFLRSAGWLIFAFYWSTQVSTLYYYENGDIVNAFICSAGVYLMIYFAYKDITSKANCLPWLSGVAGISGLIYFSMEYVPPLKTSLIELVTRHTALLYSLFDKNVRVSGNLIWAGYDYINNSSPTAEIIFACTAIQSMLLFVGLILPLRGVDIKRRLLSISFLILTIYFLNLIRNASVIYLVGYRITDMNIAHNYIGKSGSLLALIILVFLTFRYIPELYDKIICTINLYKEEGFVEKTIKRLIR